MIITLYKKPVTVLETPSLLVSIEAFVSFSFFEDTRYFILQAVENFFYKPSLLLQRLDLHRLLSITCTSCIQTPTQVVMRITVWLHFLMALHLLTVLQGISKTMALAYTILYISLSRIFWN